jgi:hypothetical protein
MVMVHNTSHVIIGSMPKHNAQALQDQPNWQSMGLPDLKTLKQRYASALPEMIEAGIDKYHARDILRAVLGIVNEQTKVIVTPVIDVHIQDWTLLHVVEKREDARERYANAIVPTLTKPLEVWKTYYDDSSYRYRFIKLFEGKKDVFVIVNVSDDGNVFWNMIPTRLNTVQTQRVGDLIYAEYRP